MSRKINNGKTKGEKMGLREGEDEFESKYRPLLVGVRKNPRLRRRRRRATPTPSPLTPTGPPPPGSHAFPPRMRHYFGPCQDNEGEKPAKKT